MGWVLGSTLPIQNRKEWVLLVEGNASENNMYYTDVLILVQLLDCIKWLGDLVDVEDAVRFSQLALKSHVGENNKSGF